MNNNTKIICGFLCKNEASRWLKDFLDYIVIFADKVIAIDDKSTDNTIEIIKEKLSDQVDYEIHEMLNTMFETNESLLRNELWNRCVKQSKINDWIVIFDCDEIISKVEASILKEILINTPNEIELFGLRLFDMWDKNHFRNDKLWNAHTRIFPFATRYKIQPYHFNTSNLHCGRFPIEVLFKQCGYTENIKVKHLGWSLPSDRKNKYERYMRTDPIGKFGDLKQYQSILDSNPNLELFIETWKELY